MPFRRELNLLHDAFRETGIPCKWNEPLASHTTFRIGGKAALTVWPTGQLQLVRVLSLWRLYGRSCPLCLLGNGSNVLVSDNGFFGLVVITNRARRVVFTENEKDPTTCYVYAECGASLSALALHCGRERNLSGLEFACGIPGTLGGAVVMNAGAFGSDIERVLLSCEYYDLDTGETGYLSDQEMDLSYRHSCFLDHPNLVVLSATMILSHGFAPDIIEKIKYNLHTRREKQPLDLPSAGSVFKRPVDNYAGRMVEEVGLKGFSIGNAQVSEKHAGFIVNRIDRGGATARDVIGLVRHIQDRVYDHFHAPLECEIRLISDGLERLNW